MEASLMVMIMYGLVTWRYSEVVVGRETLIWLD